MESETDRLLVTGATGFIGRHVVSRMLSEGVPLVLGLRHDSTVGTPFPGLPFIDLRIDQPELRSALEQHGITGCVHLAGRFVAEHGAADIAGLVASNVGLTAALADAVVAAGGSRFLTMGTVWQNAAGSDYKPVSLYAATKQAAQDVLCHFAVNEGLLVSILKLPDTYGPGDTRRKALDHLLEAARTGTLIGMSPGRQILDLVHVRDVVNAVFDLLTLPPDRAAATWRLSSGDPLTLRAVAARVEAVTGRPVPVEWGARPYRRVEAFSPWSGPILPGWEATIALDDGIEELWTLRSRG